LERRINFCCFSFFFFFFFFQVRETKEEMFLIDGVVRVCVCVALVVFNPQKGVVLTGVVTAVNGDAVQLSTGFFGQIFVPRSEWGRLKLSKGASDGAPILVDSEKPSFCVVVGDRIRARVLGCESSNQGMRVTCSLVGEFFGPLAWFVQQEG
jgi:DNA-directed RNA polymerase subunit E'/Rpb7